MDSTNARRVLTSRSGNVDLTQPAQGYGIATASPSKSDANAQQTPPKQPRSAFICFSDMNKSSIMRKYNITEEKDNVLRVVVKEWRCLSSKQRAYWDEEARNDKLRYVREKAAYKGPLIIPKKRSKKHPLAPKRPMSAFLKYSKNRRQMVKEENPTIGNTDVSRILGEMWRSASLEEKTPYIQEEERERAIYNEKSRKFKAKLARDDAASRTSHRSVARRNVINNRRGGGGHPIEHIANGGHGRSSADSGTLSNHHLGGDGTLGVAMNEHGTLPPLRGDRHADSSFDALRLDSFDDHSRSPSSWGSHQQHGALYPPSYGQHLSNQHGNRAYSGLRRATGGLPRIESARHESVASRAAMNGSLYFPSINQDFGDTFGAPQPPAPAPSRLMDSGNANQGNLLGPGHAAGRAHGQGYSRSSNTGHDTGNGSNTDRNPSSHQSNLFRDSYFPESSNYTQRYHA